MNDILKQRLVGALVIIALAVIFWPLVFVDAERPQLDVNSQVPPMPELGQAFVEAPQALATMEAAKLPTIELHEAPPGVEEAEPIVANTATQPQPRLDASGVPMAWVLQVISVSKRDKADVLTAELNELGYKAYHRPLSRGQKTLFRVYVGPEFDRDKLLQAKKKIDSELKVNAIIARYTP